MNRRGRPPTPTPILKLRGSKRAKYQRDKSEPMPEAGIPAAPAWLDREAKAEWKRLTRDLEIMQVITKIDRSALALMCQAWSDCVRLRGEVAKEGEVITMANGCKARNPKVTMMNEAFLRWAKIAGDYGLTPAARTRLRTTAASALESAKKARNRDRGRFFRFEKAVTA